MILRIAERPWIQISNFQKTVTRRRREGLVGEQRACGACDMPDGRGRQATRVPCIVRAMSV